MGGSSSKDLGRPIGTWAMSGQIIYENKDGPSINKGINNGKYQEISNGILGEGREMAFYKYVEPGNSAAGHIAYSQPINPLRQLWLKNKSAIVQNVAASAQVSAEKVANIASIAFPILLEAGRDAAEKAIKDLNPEAANISKKILDSLISHAQITHDQNPTVIAQVGGAYEMRRHYSGSGEFYNHVNDYAYQGAVEEYKKKGGDLDTDQYVGGCGCGGKPQYVGSDELDISTVRDYTNTINSKVKNQIIDEIIDAALKMGLKITGADQAAKIKSLIEFFADSKSIKSADHAKACVSMANAINSAHGNEIINNSLPPDVICQQVAEIVSSLSAGMHTEFLAVYNDVRKVLKNLHILKTALKDNHEAIVQRIKDSEDALLPQQTTTLNDLHNILTDEISRQIQLLSNLLNVTLFPAEKSLAELIKNKKDLHGYIEKIDVKIGSERFGKVIADILKGLGLTANFAILIDRALKTVGLTIDEYAKGESVQRLREKITQGLMGKNLNEAQLREYLEAAELLYKNFYRNQDIAQTLKTTREGKYEMEYDGGDDVYQKTVMDKRVADRKKLRNLIFSTFYRQINEMFDQLIGSLDVLTAKVGTEIPLSEQLNSFRHVLQRIEEELVRTKHIYHALIGYYNDAMSKSKKDKFLGDLRMISSYIDTILEMPLYAQSKQYFVNIQNYINSIIQLIDKFSDEIAAKFGRGEKHEDVKCQYLEEDDNIAQDDDDKPKAHKKDTEADDDEITGAYESGEAIYGGSHGLTDEPPILYKTTKTISDAIRQFDYKYRVAQIRSNLAAASKELSHYSEKYDKIIANSIADILTDEQKTYEKLHKQLSEDSLFGTNESYVVGGARGFNDKDEVAKERDAARKFLESQWEVKKKFWATVEAVDTYMRVFTDSLVKNPQDIKDIKTMLESIEVIGNWYSDNTGDALVSVFEQFPSFMKYHPPLGTFESHGILTDYDKLSAGAIPNRPYIETAVVYPPDSYSTIGGQHYYERIHNMLYRVNMSDDTRIPDQPNQERSALPGNPNLVTIPTRGETAKAQAKKALNGLAVLKNLLSVFVHVGNNFGGETIHKKIFMTPGQMYNNLIDYLAASAFAQGFGIENLKQNIDGDLPQSFYNSHNMAVQLDIVTGEYKDGSRADASHSQWNAQLAANETHVPVAAVETYSNMGVVHLGVTADATPAIIDYHYGPSMMANALVGKINAATDALGTDLRTNRAVAVPVGTGRQTWETATTSVQRVLLFKKRWGVWMRSTLKGLVDMEGFSFTREDEYFKLLLKCLAAKILTVTGLYDVFDRPAEFNGLSPIRMITGGLAETPKVDEGAVALYLRLPLLAQFYRGIFGFDSEGDPPNTFFQYTELRGRDENKIAKISMVPDVDGTFAGLIRLIFRKNKFTTGSNYSDEDMKELIREVNLIYQRMQSKHPQNTVMETIHEFVDEINRRYGVVSKQERDEWEREFGYRYDYASSMLSGNDRSNPLDRYNEMPETNYAILPGEGDEEVERPSAAQKLLGETFDAKEKKRLFTITTEHRDLVYKFRCAIDKYFEKPDEEYTFNHAIKSTQLKLKKEQNDEARFKIVASLVRGIDIHTKTDGMKYVLFHETVVNGLNVLSAIHSMLARFKRRAHILDLVSIEKEIWKYLSEPGVKDFEPLLARVTKYLCEDLGLAESNDFAIRQYVEKLFGYHESRFWNGGQTNVGDAYALKAGDGIIAVLAHGAENAPRRWPVAGAFHSYAQGNTSMLSTNANAPPAATRTTQVGGLVSVLAGQTVSDLQSAYENPKGLVANKSARLAAETFMRFIFSREYVMKELLESLFGFSNDFQGLVEVRIEDGKLLLSYGGLKTLIEEMFQHISYFIDLLRPHIKTDILDRYTNKFNPGSYYWLHEQLIEKIIIGRPPQLNAKPGESVPRAGYVSLDEIMQRLTGTYSRLTQTWNVDGARLSLVGPPAGYAPQNAEVNDLSDKPVKNSFDKVFAEMIFYDSSKPGSGLLISHEANQINPLSYEAVNGVDLVDYHNPYEALYFNGALGAKVMDTRFMARFKQLYSWKDDAKGITNNKSALFMFNQLVAKYIQAFYDPVSSKIYAGVIDKFANGAFSRSIADFLYTYPDTVPLWFIKYVGNTETKLPNTFLLGGMVGATTQIQIPILKDLIIQYLESGVREGDQDDPIRRAKLLNSDNEDLVVTTQALVPTGGPAPGRTNNTPKIYIYLLLHIAGALIHDMFRYFSSNGIVANTPPANNNPVGFDKPMVRFMSLGEVGVGIDGAAAARVVRGNVPITFGRLQNYYTNNAVPQRNPTIKEIMAKLLHIIPTTPVPANNPAYRAANPNDPIARVTYIITTHGAVNAANFNNRFEVPLDGSPLALVLGNRGANPVAPYLGFTTLPSKKYKPIIDSLLRYPGTFPDTTDTFGGILFLALKLFPLQNDAIGRTPEDFDYRASLFAHLVGALKDAYETIRDTYPIVGLVDAALANQLRLRIDKFNEKVTNITAAVSSTRSTFMAPTIAQPKYLIKQDDLLVANNKYLVAPNIGSPSGDANYLVMARSQAVPNALPGNYMRQLGVEPPPPGPPYNVDDSIDVIQNFGRRMDPDGDHVLFASIATVLRNLITSRNDKSSTSVYIQDNVADIAMYMKEKMRANLPFFRNLFKELNTRCEFLKRFISRNEIDLTRSYDMAKHYLAGVANPQQVDVNRNPWPYQLLPPTTTSVQTKDRFTNILDGITRGCTSIVACIDQVLRDIGDDPKFFEVYQNSIADYKSQYGVDPFMPLSTSLAVLKNVTNANSLDFFPIHPLGKEQFKIHYGLRSLLGRPTTQPQPEHYPGFSQIVDNFNLIIDNKMQADKAHADNFLKTYIKLLRYVYELKHVKGVITPYIFSPNSVTQQNHINQYNLTSDASTILHIDGLFTRDDLVVTTRARGSLATRNTAESQYGIHGVISIGPPAGPIVPAHLVNDKLVILTNRSDVSLCTDNYHIERSKITNNTRKYPVPVYAIAKTLADSLRLTESSFKDERIKELVEYLCESSKGRNTLEVQNIIDLNIVPINIHALRREIPLVNLYNYAYTFDRLVIELYYGLQNENARKIIQELCDQAAPNRLRGIKSAKDLLVALLLDPYHDLFSGENGPMSVDGPLRLYDRFAKPMLAGAANNGELGRPKFLSDQIFNKVVFGELYSSYSDYNEVGPVASRGIHKVKITEQVGISIIGNLAAQILVSLNTANATKYHNRILANGQNKTDVLVNFCTAIAKHLVQTPNTNAKTLVTKILGKFLKFSNNKGITEFNALRVAPVHPITEDLSSTQLAIFASIAVTLLHRPIVDLINQSNTSVLTDDDVKAIARKIAMSLLVFDSFGVVANSNYLGLSQNGQPLNAGGAVPTDPASLKTALIHSFQNAADFDSAVALAPLQGATTLLITNVAGVGADPAAGNYITDAKFVKYINNTLHTKLNIDYKVPIALDVNAAAQIPAIAAIYNELRTVLSQLTPPTEASIDRPLRGNNNPHLASNALHWLHTNVQPESPNEDYGAVRQPDPLGDNDNVMDENQIKSVALTESMKNILAAVGRLRFDTKLIRNLIFIVNLYRTVRVALQRNLTYSKDIIMRAEPITRQGLTEFYGNQVAAGMGPIPYRGQHNPMWNRYNY